MLAAVSIILIAEGNAMPVEGEQAVIGNGDAMGVRPGETPVFWACGVTPQAVAMEVRPPLLITHKPGCMFVTDLRDTDLEGG